MTPETAATRRPGAAEVAEPKARILLVDDHVESVQAMAASLQVLGEEVLTATSAEIALRHLLKNNVAVIVLDVMMPGMDGLQLASLIRQRERTRNVPIIFLTGLRDEGGRMLQGYRSGAVDYITKPCDLEVLRFKVKSFVELAKKNEMLRRYAELVERKNQELEENAAALQAALERSLRNTTQLQQEIADRKHAEAIRDRLAGQLGGQPDFVEAMAEGAVTLALDQTVLYCNGRFAALLGASAHTIAGARLTSCIHPNSREAFDSLFEQALSSSTKAELNLLSATGEAVPVQMALNRFKGPELEAVALVVTDLRDHRRNEEVLAQGRLAQLILEYSMTGIAVCDPGGRITLASAGLRELCGASPLLKPFDEVLALSCGNGPLSITQVLRGKVHFSKEVVFQRADGRRFTLLLSAGPIVDTAGNCAGGVVVLVDVSEWKQVEEALRRSEKLAAAGRIASTLAHEVNNPLNSVTNLLFLLEANKSLDAEARQYLNLASAELGRVSHIVRSTLAFYRDSTTPVRLNLPEILDNVLELFRDNSSAKNLTILKRYGSSDPAFGFPGEIRQVVSNLLANAIDATPEHGRILLRIRAARNRRTGASGVRIVIGDSGPGISAQHLPKLFEPFFTTKGEKGTGLGLWVTQGIVQKHGGFIRVRSLQHETAHGTVFSVFLPLTSELNTVTAAAARASEGGLAAKENPLAA